MFCTDSKQQVLHVFANYIECVAFKTLEHLTQYIVLNNKDVPRYHLTVNQLADLQHKADFYEAIDFKVVGMSDEEYFDEIAGTLATDEAEAKRMFAQLTEQQKKAFIDYMDTAFYYEAHDNDTTTFSITSKFI